MAPRISARRGQNSAGSVPILAEVVEQLTKRVEHSSGLQQLLVAERLERRAPAGLVAGPPLLDDGPTALGQRDQDDTPISLGALALDEAGSRERVEHLGDGCGGQVGGTGQFARGQLVVLSQPEQESVLCVAQLAWVARLAPAESTDRRNRALEGPPSWPVLGAAEMCDSPNGAR